MAEQITFRCVACNKALTVPARTAGRRGKCKHCGAVNTVPRLLTPEPAAPPGAAPTSADPAGHATRSEALGASLRSSPATSKFSGLAVASLVLGIVGFCSVGLSAIVGLILGIVGLARIKRSGGAVRGQGVAIAGILVSGVALLFAAFVAALIVGALPFPSQTRDSVEINNLRQLALAAHVYADQWEGVLPPGDTWPQALKAYTGSEDRLRSPHNPGAGRAYAINAAIAGRHLNEIPDLTETVLFFEAEFGSPPSGGPGLLPANPRGRHGYGIAFVDGHVAAVPKDEVGNLIWQ